MNNERWARRVFRYTSLKGVSTQWSRRLYSLCRKFSLFTDPVQEDSERKWSMEVRTRVQEAETSMWQSAMDQKSSLALYRVHKTTISVERLYDNSAGSALLFETRAGALRTKIASRKRNSRRLRLMHAVLSFTADALSPEAYFSRLLRTPQCKG
ncbi:hypothetical protein HPB49_003930 [Dermacentor silvarum]|uniref:Uncharacterized protein n=1 Tax=Dermacentor silvarum TaxID=543639 RepID=A0ACB8DU38_DERSI|nr:hypothetical protein HPB49_003930 [Dermacentor silvarum]